MIDPNGGRRKVSNDTILADIIILKYIRIKKLIG